MCIVDKTKDLVWIKVLCCRQQNPLQASIRKTVLTKGYSLIDSLQEGHTGLAVTHRNSGAKDSTARGNEESELKRVVLKVCSQTSRISITWAFGRDENSQASPQTH